MASTTTATSPPPSATLSVVDACKQAKSASKVLRTLPSGVKDAALQTLATLLLQRAEQIVHANEIDMAVGVESGLSHALLDRLKLDQGRIAGIAKAVRAVAALPDPVGRVVSGSTLPNGLTLRKVKVPLGVVAVVYEARPNVTIDAAALCVKSGNAIVLKGSSAAVHSNAMLAKIACEAVESEGLPRGAITLLDGGREQIPKLATQSDTVDLIIPRGGEGLKQALADVATVPVIYAASGNCHVYVDAGADLDMAQAIALNAKVQRPGVCNAAETLLVHEAVAQRFLPSALQALIDAGVTIKIDERGRALGGAPRARLQAATQRDWETEYLALTLAVKVVGSVQEAIEHIERYGSGHSEAIVTNDLAAAQAFQSGVDAACVYVNASTRFTDGGELGLGAEIGNSTQKLHARGPIGLEELCSEKYLIEGSGHVRA